MFSKKKISIYIKTISLGLLTWAYGLNSFSQCISHEQFWNNILKIENSTAGTEKKLEQLTRLKYQYIKCGFSKDSVYARMLHRIASLQMKANNYNEAIQNNLKAININKSGTPGACRWYVSFTYLNTGFCYAYSLINSKALLYFDSVILESKIYPQVKKYLPIVRYQRGNIFYNRGDYEKDIEETTLGLQAAKEMSDTTQIIFLLLERCQAHEKQLKIREGLNDVNTAIALLKNYADNDSYANAYRYKADLLADQKNFTEALKLFDTAIHYRIKTGDLSMVSTDYNDAGYMLLYTCNQPVESKAYFIKAYNLASKINNKNTCALACNNLGQLNFNDKNYEAALDNYQKSIQLLLPHYQVKGVTENPSYKELSNLESKSFTEILLDNRSRCLLYLYKKTHHKNYLNASVATALLNDSLITDLRHEQTDEQSKLFWRNDSRDFFTNALEACTLDNNPALAFFFMEKSRAVLLNDKLNELGAAMLLPAKESALEENLRANITVQEQELSILKDSTKEYVLQLNKVLQAKEDFQQYIKSLEQNYPAYYQYKYADEVPSLKDLQNYLAKNNQTFVHYFLGDTVTYILAITSNNTNLIRLSQQDFNKEQLVQFLQFCANKELLNSSYNSFAQLSNSIYQKIFQPLQLRKGRVIICADNIVIPFDALCTDENGKNFLLNDYSFSYVYSARSLMKPFNNPAASGNFIGFAPVSFAPYLKVQDLKNAADALQASASYYKKDKLFVHQNASRKNFFDYASSYSVVSIFSHARADTTDNEPVLFMQDSVIHLSELQLLDNPATKLVLLSACQTNVGKTATGEGIYSLARGFATAGIPSVAATLWKADEQTIYSISEKFNQYLSEGMNKDEALQKAKLLFIQSNPDNEKMLPYFWANMILIGNNDAITFTTIDHTYIWIIVAACLLILILAILILKKRAKNY